MCWYSRGFRPEIKGKHLGRNGDVGVTRQSFYERSKLTPNPPRVPMQSTNDRANLYRIETAQKAVILTMLGGEEVRGNVFIHFSSYRPFELEDVSELFNADSPFFPLELETGEVMLISKERVAEVAADRGEDANDQPPREAPMPTALLQILLVGGEVRLGSIRLEARADRARVSDYLNALTSRFLTLYTSNEARLINRSLIDRVRPLD